MLSRDGDSPELRGWQLGAGTVSRSNLGVLREENWRGNSTSLDGPQESVWGGAGVGGGHSKLWSHQDFPAKATRQTQQRRSILRLWPRTAQAGAQT